MSKQIQIRRGTTSEHTNFTGAIGEITMDTDTKTIRVHDGTTVGGVPLARRDEIPATYQFPDNMDYVVEMQKPTAANNYAWYRKYKSGWIEQGGIANTPQQWISITLPHNMVNGFYTLVLSCSDTDYNANNVTIAYANKTATGFSLNTSLGGIYYPVEVGYYICGF